MKLANPIATATKGKGLWNMLKRVTVIGRRYGLTARKMNRIMTRFATILETFDAQATFPITGMALARSRGFAETFQRKQIELAAHGYYHVDHTQLSLEEQIKQITAVSQLLATKGVKPVGFRCPYLRWCDDTVTAIKQAGFLYDGSQALAWDIDESLMTEAYRRVLQFYGAVSANIYPALPRLEHGLVRIPYCLPDDEALIDRLAFPSQETMNAIWPHILNETHRQGELFTLGLHPERLELCEAALTRTLQQAQQLSPKVWQARLDEIAAWWQARLNSNVIITTGENNACHVTISGPEGVTVLARGLEIAAPTTAWDAVYRQVEAFEFTFQAEKRPFIGVSPHTAPSLTSFLQQQGYIVESVSSGDNHVIFLDQPQFAAEEERPLLTNIEQGDFPLVRLGRWPNGARSALCITGDIDALTIWDYGLRFLGN